MKTLLLYPFYNLFVRMFATTIRFAAFFGHKKAQLWVEGRKPANYQSFQKVRQTREKWMWFHCASLGEYEDSAEVFETIRHQFPEYGTLLTFSSPSGFEALKKRSVCDQLLYLPVDTATNAYRFITLVQPQFAVFSRSELWLNHLFELKKRKIPAFLIGLRFQTNSNFLKWPARLVYSEGFSTFKHIYCQNEATLNQLRELKLFTGSVVGNFRFTRIIEGAEKPVLFPEIEQFTKDHFTLIVGSSLPKDQAILLKTIPLMQSSDRIILVPHEPIEKLLSETEQRFPGKCIRFSNIRQADETHRILIVDKVGILKHLYRYGQAAFVGGGFDRIGIHNIIEPAVYGCPPVFGPHHRNYPEAIDLLKSASAQIIRNEVELSAFIEEQRSLSNERKMALSQDLKSYVLHHAPDSKTIVQHMQSALESVD